MKKKPVPKKKAVAKTKKKFVSHANPHWVCSACGITANYLTCLRRYGAPPLKACFQISTFHERQCEFCGLVAFCTEARDFFYPDFNLIKDYANAIGAGIEPRPVAK